MLDPYMGSGSTGKAAILEGFDFIGVELDDGYFDISISRITECNTNGKITRNEKSDIEKY